MTFVEKKAKNLFLRFDTDGNGTLEEDDLEKWTDKLIELRNLDVVKQDEIRQQMKKIWKEFFLPADFDKDGKVGKDEVVNFVKSLSNDTERNNKGILDAFSVIYDAIDVNHDGGISSEEFSIYFKSLGIDNDEFIAEVFREMDSDGSDSLSVEEFSQFGLEFFIGTDETSPSRHFFGPLTD